MSGKITSSQVVRFAVALVIMALLVFVLEIVPLHYGAHAVPWNEMGRFIHRKLPRMIVISLMVSGYLAFGIGRSKTDDS